MSLSLNEFWLEQQTQHGEGRLLMSPVEQWASFWFGLVGLFFILSCMCIPFLAALLIKTEQKFAKQMAWIRQYTREIKMIDENMPLIQDNFKLVHLQGPVINSAGLLDKDFGIICENGYRIERKVEMKQWKEFLRTRTVKKGKSKKKEQYFAHATDWYEHKIDSKRFKQRHGHENPDINWPYESQSQQAEEVMLGLTFLRKNIIDQLGWSHGEDVIFSNTEREKFCRADRVNNSRGFNLWEPHGRYMEAKPLNFKSETSGVGTLRLSYRIYKCEEATVIGQQIQDEKGLITIRKYNHEIKEAPYGANTNFIQGDGGEQECCGRCCKWMQKENVLDKRQVTKCLACCCCSCRLMRWIVGTKKLDKTIIYVADGHVTLQSFVNFQKLKKKGKLYFTRGISWIVLSFSLLSILGFQLYPIISGLQLFNFFRWAGFGDWGSFICFFLLLGFAFTFMLSGFGVFAGQKPLGLIMILLGAIVMAIICSNFGGRLW